MKDVTLITGGARSGKSRYALKLAESFSKRVFIATCEPIDEEMKERIERHRRERGDGFRTVEEPVDLAGVVASLDTEAAVVDCLTVWLGNLIHRDEEIDVCHPRIEAFLKTIEAPPCNLIIVTNELGMSIVPANPLSRRFRDLSGRVNREVAERSGRVILMVSGIPLIVKESE